MDEHAKRLDALGGAQAAIAVRNMIVNEIRPLKDEIERLAKLMEPVMYTACENKPEPTPVAVRTILDEKWEVKKCGDKELVIDQEEAFVADVWDEKYREPVAALPDVLRALVMVKKQLQATPYTEKWANTSMVVNAALKKAGVNDDSR